MEDRLRTRTRGDVVCGSLAIGRGEQHGIVVHYAQKEVSLFSEKALFSVVSDESSSSSKE